MPEHTDNSEAMRLALWLKARQSHLGASRESCWDEEQSCWDNYDKAAALLRKLPERIAELELQPAFAQLASDLAVKLAATEAERDRLLRAVAADTKMVFDLCAERDRLREEVERLRADGERLDYIEKHARCDPKMDNQHVWWPTNFNDALKGNTLRAAIDAARTTHKETE